MRVTKPAGPVLNSSSIELTTTLKPQQDLNAIQSQTPPEADGTAIKAPWWVHLFCPLTRAPFVQVGKQRLVTLMYY